MKSSIILIILSLYHKIHNCSSWVPTTRIKPIYPNIQCQIQSQKSIECEDKQTKEKDPEWKVIHQKVISNIPISLVISYIRDIFPIPSTLTIPYQRSSVEKYKHLQDEGGSIILSFVCSMDEDLYTTEIPKSSLVVQVLGICVGEEGVPSMAMVSVKKMEGMGMFGGFEEDSEKVLMGALERGLDDLIASRGYASPNKSVATKKVETTKKNVSKKKKDSAPQVTKDIKENSKKEIKSIIDFIPEEKRKKSSSKDTKKKGNDKEVKSIIDLIPEEKRKKNEEPVKVDIISNSKTKTKDTKNSKSIIDVLPTKETNIKSKEPNLDLDSIVPKSIQDINTTLDDSILEDNIDLSQMEQGVDLSPQELLQDMLSFDEEDKELNFATNAMDKAKELMEDNLLNRMDLESEEEELKRIFKEGQKLAELRMDPDWLDNKDTKYVDDWIQSDTSIRDAVQLEEDLAEFEMRVASRNPSTNENEVNTNRDFDIFNNPNLFQGVNDLPIDPLTENWPGRKHTVPKNIPKELKDAYNNAMFASNILISLREEVDGDKVTYYVKNKEISIKQVQSIISCVEESIKIGLIQDPFIKMEERNTLDILLNEMDRLHGDAFDEERFQEVIHEYKDLLLSDNFIELVKDRLEQPEDKERHERLKFNLSKLVRYAMFLLKETQAFGSELEAQQLEVIRSICEVAMDPRKSEEETALALQEKVCSMKPLLDDVFVSYLKYAIEEEEARLARRGILDSMEHFQQNQWLMVLKIVQAGVYAELSKGINRHLEHIWYVLRMETRQDRKLLLSKIIDDMPTLDIRPFIKVVDNIASSLGSTARGEFRDDGYELSKLTSKILQLSKDVHELLPEDKIRLRSRDADEWLRRKREGFLEGRKAVKAKLKQSVEEKKLGGKVVEEEGGLFMP